jgi:MFS family permease
VPPPAAPGTWQEGAQLPSHPPPPPPQGGFDLTTLQDGLLATAFMVGLLLASPVFSESCKHYNAFRLIGIGMGTWMLATLGCGLSVGFYSLIFCRMFVGVGEASFVALAAPFIGARAP